MKTDQPNGTWEVFQYHAHPQEPRTSAHADPLSLPFSSPALQMISQPISPKASITHHRWFPPNHPPGSLVLCLLDSGTKHNAALVMILAQTAQATPT